MQLYVLDRAKNTLATTSSFYSDKHHKELTAGASIFEFTIDKSDSAAQYMTTGNYLVFKDDRGRAWSFTILSYDETQTTKTVAAEDVSIELLNKAMDVWNTDQAYPFSYYFDLVTKGTPWTLGVNQLTDLSRKLVYTGRDTGLGRLLSVLKGFDNAECQFNIKVQQNKPVEFVVDVYKSIGTVQDNIQIVYNNELADIKKTESRAQFVTALAGIGGLVENQATTDPGLEKHIDFADIDYKDDNFVSPKGDKFLRAVTANRTFNPGTTTYIEDFYDYDTQSAQELLNRTLTQLKERSEPQYTYNADVKVIDPTLDIGDTVTIIDHDYNPALYLQARVATLDKSYTDPTQGAITFCNYRVLSSNLSDQLRAMQNIIDQLPTSASIKVINNNTVQMIADNTELKKQVTLALKSANGKNVNYYGPDKPMQPNAGDIWFKQNGDKQVMMIYRDGQWHELASDMTGEEIKSKVDEAFANDEALQKRVEDNDTKIADNIAKTDAAVDAANQAVSAAGFANDVADQAKTAATNAQADAANALGQASTAIADAATAINAATDAQTKTRSLVTKVDDIAGTIETLATTETVDQLAGTVATTQSLAQFAADGLKLKADTTTVDKINGTVNDLKGELDVQADKIAATVTASDVTGMLGNYATQSWSQGQISAAKNEISASVETVQNNVDNLSFSGRNLVLDTAKPFTMTGNGTANNSNGMYLLSKTIAKGTTVTVTFDITSTNSAGVYGVQFINSSWQGISPMLPLASGTQHHSYTLVTDADYSDGVQLRLDNSTSKVTVSNFIISESSKEVSWTPAPEDMATQDWTKSLLDVSEGKVTAQVQSVKTDLTNTLNNNIASATAGMATQTWTQGKIETTADEINSTVTSVSSKVDNLQIGGKNYIENSQPTNDSGWFFKSGGTNNHKVVDGQYIEITRTGGSYHQINRQYQNDNDCWYSEIKPGDQFAISMDISMTTVPTLDSNIYGQLRLNAGDTFNSTQKYWNLKDIIKKANKWYRVSAVADITAHWETDFTKATMARFLIESISGSDTDVIRIRNIKLEKGNKATDWSPAPEDMATVTQFTSIEETLKGVQVTANNAVTQSQYTQLAGQITSVIGGMGQKNLIKNTEFNDLSEWTFARPNFWQLGTNQYDSYKGSNTLYFAGLSNTSWTSAQSNAIPVYDGEVISASAILFSTGSIDAATPTGIVQIEADFYDTIDGPRQEIYGKKFNNADPYAKQLLKLDNIKVPASRKFVRFLVYVQAGAHFAIAHPMLVKDTFVGEYQPNTVSESQITQLQSDINLRVKTGDFASAMLNINNMIEAKVDNDDFIDTMLSMSDAIDLKVYNAKNGNLLRNSEFITDKYWTKTGNHGFLAFDPTTYKTSVPTIWLIAAGAGAKTGGQLTTEFKADGLKNHDKVTLSFYALGTAGTQLTFTLNGATLDTYAVTLTATRTYYTLSLVYDTGNKLSVFADRADQSIMIDSLMLVKGDTAMPWEPAGDNVLTRIYLDQTDVLIQGKQIHLDGEATIDKAIIKSAMIDTVSANKLTAGTIDANDINVIHINGQNITANSITADKLAANAIQVGLNNLGSVIQLNPTSLDFYNSGQRSMSLQKDGMHIIDYLNNEDVGLIHVNRLDGHDNVNGLEFDLNKNGDYMAWGQRSDDTSLYTIKMGWFSSYAASQSGFARGVNIADDLTINSDYTAYLTKIGTNYAEHRYIEFSNTNVDGTPGVLIGSTSGTGILIGNDAIFLVFGGGVYNMWNVIHSIGTGRKW